MTRTDTASGDAAPSRTAPEQDEPRATAALVVAVVGLVVPLVLSLVALFLARHAEIRIVDARGRLGGRGRARLAARLGRVGVFLGILVLVVLAAYLGREGLKDLQETFFDWSIITGTFGKVLDGFQLNVRMFLVAEVLVLIWGLAVALMRMATGPAWPLRVFAVVYVDVFRGLPALLTIYLVGFGLPIAYPSLSDVDPLWWGIVALTLVYGAYVGEVYRAGIESVHWSQTAAARSLGLSHLQTMRHVVIPQAVRRIIPPLLNDFIGLQKDTALVSTIGVLEAFRRASIVAGNRFNPSPIIGVAICFLVVTIPLTRLTDWLVRRDQRKIQAGT